MIDLRRPAAGDKLAVEQIIKTVVPVDSNFLHYYEPGLAYENWLRRLRMYEVGIDLPEGHVPSTQLLAFSGSEVVGRLSIRHSLNDHMRRVGGHVGYVVIPQHRLKGIAKQMLKDSLPLCKSLGLNEILLTCDDDNVGSIRTIEANGGVFEDAILIKKGQPLKRRYWIKL